MGSTDTWTLQWHAATSSKEPRPALAAGPPAAARLDGPGKTPIVDTHQHLWDLSRFRLPWLKGAAKLDRSFLMNDYRRATEGLGVVASVYMEVNVEPAQQAAEADYVLDLIRRGEKPMVGAVISGRPESNGFATFLARYQDQPAIKGLRRVLHAPDTPRGHCFDARFIAGIRLLGRMGLSFDLCMRPAELGDAVKLVNACPDTTFILDHCGNASIRTRDLSGWKADIGRLAERQQRGLQGLGDRRLGRAGPVDGGRFGADRQPRLGSVRAGSPCLRWRLAGLHAGRDLSAVGRGAAAYDRRPASDRAEEALPRQRDPGLSPLTIDSASGPADLHAISPPPPIVEAAGVSVST